jgi:hypothetical protein
MEEEAKLIAAELERAKLDETRRLEIVAARASMAARAAEDTQYAARRAAIIAWAASR